jgi:hypothetical protein
MWEQWRAEIDRSLRDAALAQDRWYEHGFRAELRNEPEKALGQFRLFSASTLRRSGGQTSREMPRSWRLRIGAWRARPVL